MGNKIKPQLQSVHFLRALASLLVCAFHLYCGNIALFPEPSPAKAVFSMGYLGVEMFFLLSGFIICYALPANYNYNQFIPFISKRLVRIEPPYIISMFLVIVLNSLSHLITGLPNHIDWLNALLHLAYIHNFGTGDYLNVVYWTLGIEFQFYLLIALFFPLLMKARARLFILVLFAIISCLPAPENMRLITGFLSMFGMGILTYFYQIKKQVSLLTFSILTVAFLVQIYYYHGLHQAGTCILSTLILLFWKRENRLILFFSSISFSLYLTHTLIGGKIVNLGLRFVHSLPQRHALFFAAFLGSVIFAYLFYLLIEKPAMALSKKIHYKVTNAS